MIKVKFGGGVQSALWSAALLSTTMLAGVPAALAQDAERTTMIDDIIVTAQKRDENLQDVPISIQALGNERLEQMGVSDFNDYVKLLPSVSYQTVAPGFSGVYMRGIASGGDGNHSGSLPSVGALASFVGLVRDINDGSSVSEMTLEHYPGMTEKALEEIVSEA